MTQGS